MYEALLFALCHVFEFVKLSDTFFVKKYAARIHQDYLIFKNFYTMDRFLKSGFWEMKLLEKAFRARVLKFNIVTKERWPNCQKPSKIFHSFVTKTLSVIL